MKKSKQMEVQQINITELKNAVYNPRFITDDEAKGLKASLEKYGLVEPIVVNHDMTVIGGHQRLKIWAELGNETIPCVVLHLDKKEEKKLNVLLNSQAISGHFEMDKLAEILVELKNDSDFFELRLDQLHVNFSMDDSVGMDDFSDKNKEVNVEDLGEQSAFTFKYPHDVYLELLEKLQDLKEYLKLETNEEVIQYLIENESAQI